MANKLLDSNGLLYFYQKLKTYIASVVPTKQSDLTNDDYTVKDADYNTYKNKISSLETQVNNLVVTGGEPNVIEDVKVNGTSLQVANKAVNVEIVTGTANGSLAVNGTDVSVAGLGSAAYTNSTAYDQYGSADAVLGASNDPAGTATVYGALASAAAAQAGVTAINNAGYQTQTDVNSAIATAVNGINNMGYQTASDVTTAITSYNYQTASDVTTAINNALSNISGISYEVVNALPQSGETGVIYLISNNGTNPNIYDEYIWYNNRFEKIGTTDVDLSNYLQTTDIALITNAEIDTIMATGS